MNPAAIRARIRLVAHERGLPPDEVKQAIGLRDRPLIEFIRRHRLSFDWVLAGDLRGRLRQARRCI